MAIFLVLWPLLLTTKHSCLQKNNLIGTSQARNENIIQIQWVQQLIFVNKKLQRCINFSERNPPIFRKRSWWSKGAWLKISLEVKFKPLKWVLSSDYLKNVIYLKAIYGSQGYVQGSLHYEDFGTCNTQIRKSPAFAYIS